MLVSVNSSANVCCLVATRTCSFTAPSHEHFLALNRSLTRELSQGAFWCKAGFFVAGPLIPVAHELQNNFDRIDTVLDMDS